MRSRTIPWGPRLLALSFFVPVAVHLQANNLTISPPLLIDNPTAVAAGDIRFNISWQNSWRVSSGPANWDAAWVFLKFRVGIADPTRTGVSSAGTTLNVGNTTNLRIGMPVIRIAGTGAIPANTVITAIPSGTQVTVSAAPTTALAGATVRFIRIWEHMRLANDAAHGAPAGSTVRTGLLNPAAAYNINSNYGVGVFIHRSTNGTGTFTANNVELRWNYGSQGLVIGDPVEVCAFGHELVYVTGGSFRVGSGAGNGLYGEFYSYPNGSNTYLIGSEAAITVGTSNGNLYYDSGTFYQPGDRLGPIPAPYPKGTIAFYCMKYELSQADYVNFLNRLTRQQQDARTATTLPAATTAVAARYVMSNTTAISARNGIRCNATVAANDPVTFYCDLNGNGTGNEAADGQWIPCNFLRWSDLSAYLDWSGLRPMSELEFEKTCRGPLNPVLNERAWGTATIATNVYGLVNAGTANEQVTSGYGTVVGNAASGQTVNFSFGPLRGGIFPHHASNSGRITAGASYFGALHMSGNLGEFCITVGQPAGRAYTGTHGNGMLNQAGAHDAAAWPTVITGWGYRGGSYWSSAAGCSTSYRFTAGLAPNGATEYVGGRGVRRAP